MADTVDAVKMSQVIQHAQVNVRDGIHTHTLHTTHIHMHTHIHCTHIHIHTQTYTYTLHKQTQKRTGSDGAVG